MARDHSLNWKVDSHKCVSIFCDNVINNKSYHEYLPTIH